MAGLLYSLVLHLVVVLILHKVPALDLNSWYLDARHDRLRDIILQTAASAALRPYERRERIAARGQQKEMSSFRAGLVEEILPWM